MERQQHLRAGFGDANSLRSASIQYTGHCFWNGGVSTTVNMRRLYARDVGSEAVLRRVSATTGRLPCRVRPWDHSWANCRGVVAGDHWRGTLAMNVDHYTWRVTWSAEDGEHVGLCAEFTSLSCLAASPEEALAGIRAVVADCVKDMLANAEPVPEPIADRR